jgi:hypothetical protein
VFAHRSPPGLKIQPEKSKLRRKMPLSGPQLTDKTNLQVLPSLRTDLTMSQFLYLQFNVTPKGSLAHAIGNETVAIELPTKHVADWRIERPHLKLSDKALN